MDTRRAWPACFLILALLAGCQTLSRGRTQAIPATSRPPGVRVIVDEALVGETPITLKMTRRAEHVVRFEAQGYRPVEIHFVRKRPPLGETILTSLWGAPAGAVVLGLPGYAVWNAIDKLPEEGELGRGLFSMAVGALAGWVIVTAIDAHIPSNRDLAPQTVFIEIEKSEAPAAPKVIHAPADRLGDIRWLRIALLD